MRLRYVKYFLVFLFVFVISNGTSFAASDSWKSRKLYKKARKDMRKGMYLTAYDKLSEAYWLDPFNDAALKEIDKMTKNFKDKLSTWCEYDFEQGAYAEGFLYYTQGDYKNAVKEWKKILTVKDNTEVRGYLDFVSAQLKKGADKEKLKYGGKAKIDRIAAEKKKAEKKKRKKKKRRAVKKKRKPAKKKAPPPKPVKKKVTMKIDRAKAEKYYNEGLQQYSQGYLKNAITSWEKTLKYNPKHTRAKRALRRARAMLKENK